MGGCSLVTSESASEDIEIDAPEFDFISGKLRKGSVNISMDDWEKLNAEQKEEVQKLKEERMLAEKKQRLASMCAAAFADLVAQRNLTVPQKRWAKLRKVVKAGGAQKLAEPLSTPEAVYCDPAEAEEAHVLLGEAQEALDKNKQAANDTNTKKPGMRSRVLSGVKKAVNGSGAKKPPTKKHPVRKVSTKKTSVTVVQSKENMRPEFTGVMARDLV